MIARLAAATRPVMAPRDQLRLEPTLLNLVDALDPTKVTAAMQTIAINATSNAYSTRLAPSSSPARRDWIQQNSAVMQIVPPKMCALRPLRRMPRGTT